MVIRKKEGENLFHASVFWALVEFKKNLNVWGIVLGDWGCWDWGLGWDLGMAAEIS